MIIVDGDLPSIVACAAAREAFLAWASESRLKPSPDAPAPHPAAWIVPQLGTVGRQRMEAARAAAGAFVLEAINPADPLPAATTPGEQLSQLLLRAAFVAATHGKDTVLWPFNTPGGDGVDLDEVARAVDRSMLITRLASIDSTEHGKPAIRIDPPYADFSDRQLAELAVDLGVPVNLCWWWSSDLPDAAEPRDRWLSALTAAGWRPSPALAPRRPV